MLVLLAIILCGLALWQAVSALWALIQDSDEDFYSPRLFGISTWIWRRIAASVVLAAAGGASLFLPHLMF